MVWDLLWPAECGGSGKSSGAQSRLQEALYIPTVALGTAQLPCEQAKASLLEDETDAEQRKVILNQVAPQQCTASADEQASPAKATAPGPDQRTTWLNPAISLGLGPQNHELKKVVVLNHSVLGGVLHTSS